MWKNVIQDKIVVTGQNPYTGSKLNILKTLNFNLESLKCIYKNPRVTKSIILLPSSFSKVRIINDKDKITFFFKEFFQNFLI